MKKPFQNMRELYRWLHQLETYGLGLPHGVTVDKAIIEEVVAMSLYSANPINADTIERFDLNMPSGTVRLVKDVWQ